MEGLRIQCIAIAENAVTVEFDAGGSDLLPILRQFHDELERNPFSGYEETTTAFSTATVYFNPMEVWKLSGDLAPSRWVMNRLEERMSGIRPAQGETRDRIVDIPVCYGGEWGPDLDETAQRLGISAGQLIQLHSGSLYTVQMIGFAPGFPYLAGLDSRLAVPRRAVPRKLVPAGSVAIGGNQTGIYPLDLPGGWNVIGATPLRLFMPECDPPVLLKAGDRLRFMPIDEEQYWVMKQGGGAK